MYYHKNVGVLLLNNIGNVFLGYRVHGGTSLPQGNVEENEDWIDAGKRELYEETGLQNISNIRMIDGIFSYMIPGKNCGKIQRWMIANWDGNEEINFLCGPYQEFIKYKWCDINHALDNCVWFKRDIYKVLATILMK